METLYTIGSYLIWVFALSFTFAFVVATAEQIVVLWKTYKK